ncbi:LuxR C-terminal-related transcriptional regulator [Yersinia nurmii]|uniref:LuxR C-terminal-related transcriptional regulator n=1 Tax=Yersinia nurmii TaxID=685706 RepID=A0AAW7K6D7_9GAMM|nr:LuxR C-terminal-related transcriptional regulator [Yersinia nurmii]MDN0086130.1 LuxR C-terminal-related transcriptional regulator [Yersinia nurmii]
MKPMTEALTRREREVLESLALGMTNCSIANVLRISVKTVSNHKRTAMAKLNFRNSTELHYWFLRGGLAELTQQNSEPVHPAINIATVLSPKLSTMLNTSRLITTYPALLKQVYSEGNITSETGSARHCGYQDKLMLSRINNVSNIKIYHHV